MATSDSEDDYLAFTRRMLDDLAAGRRQSADHYAKLFPGAAEQIRDEVPGPTSKTILVGASRAAFNEVPLDDALELEPLPLPERIGKYEITGELPAGGMGRLFLARHPDSEQKLVIKTAKPGLTATDSSMLDRLRREATILGRLEHDRICPVTDVLVEGDRVFVVMPFIHGDTLEARIRQASARMRQPSPPSTSALELMEEVARAIHAAHEKGVIHRDLKPGNVMVRPDGHPVVLDFGLAVDLSDAQSPRLTVRGDVLGTPSYMAPEQIRSQVDAIDRRTDVYALGVILYEVLTYQRAFRGADLQSIYDLVLGGRIDPPRKVNPMIRRDLEAVCLKAMEPDQERRYATALDLAEDLKRVRKLERTEARPSSRMARLVRKVTRALHRRPFPRG